MATRKGKSGRSSNVGKEQETHRGQEPAGKSRAHQQEGQQEFAQEPAMRQDRREKQERRESEEVGAGTEH